MTYDPQKHHRKSVRLKEYDYSKPSAYFVTICTYNKECILGTIANGKTQLNEYGKIVDNEWLKTPTIRPYVLLDKYIIMPNHIHGIIILECRDTEPRVPPCNRGGCKITHPHVPPFEQFGKPTSHSIPTIIRSFKAATTKQIHEIQKNHRQAVWQPRFYEHIIRNPHELDQTREYIINNPLKWELDSENPDNKI